MSRSESPVTNSAYQHIVVNVQDDKYLVKLKSVLEQGDPVDVCIFCVGIGELLDLSNMEEEARIVDVNLLAMIKDCGMCYPPHGGTRKRTLHRPV